MKYLVMVSLFAVVGSSAVTAAAQQGFVQDRFAIGFWVDPPMDAQADARYKEIADANFTMVIGGFGANTPEKVQQQLELCEKYGLKALVAQAGLAPENLPESPACWGYTLRDEPSAADFADLAAKAAPIRAAHPGKMVYVNLFPDYASEKQLGTSTYDEHVRRFVEVYDPEVLSMDHYPIFKPESDGRDGYCRNLDAMRKYSMQADIPFWNFFNIMPYGPHTDPTESQVRWQIYASVAYGAKGVLYFCYYTPAGGEFPKGGAIIYRDDRRSRHYYEAQRVNAELVKLGPTLMQLTSTGVYRVTPEDDAAAALEGSPIVNITRADVDPPNDYLVGAYEHADGRRAVLLMNYRFAYSAWPTVAFDAPTEQVHEVDKQTGELRPLVDDSPDMEGLQLSLDAGEGRLFLLPAE